MTALRQAVFLRLFAIVVAVMAGAAAADPPPEFTAAEIEFFEKEVRPLLVEHCQKCHGGRAQKGNLRLDSRAAILAGGDTGSALVLGKPEESLLIDAVSYGEVYQMPPSGKLPEREIAVLRRWVELGAPWPNEVPPRVAADEHAGVQAAFDLGERAKHWAFQPLLASGPPVVGDQAWARSEVDNFILSRVEAAGLSPSPAADKRTLLRRASFDLLGLPPRPQEIEAFLADERPDAFQCVVDRMLASPHFGERRARHWLDLVRYAESKGHEFDYTIPNAWQYRDYVIRAFNADVPYDQFVMEHVAGDLVDPPRRHPQQGFNESVLGTGFWFLGEEVHSPIELAADELDRTDNKIDVFSKTFLALTVACARCHDHKFDAISTKDYYALAGYLLSSGYRQVPFDALDKQRATAQRLAALRAEHRAGLMEAMHAAIRPTIDRLPELLLAARDVLLAPQGQTSADAAARGQLIASIAKARQLAAADLAAWVAAVSESIGEPGSPLHVWAVAATEAGQDGSSLATRLKAIAARTGQRPNESEAPARVLLDFAQLAPAEWRPDGFTFGLRPAKLGEPAFGPSAQRPIERIWSIAAAVSDPFWDATALAPGVEREPGRVAWLQAGRLLRTPTFTLQGGKLHYLVSGSGYAYAVVHSHRMNNGPLHGALIREWQAGESFQWIEHDLSVYDGQRLHIEFCPRQPGETKSPASPVLAVAKVVEAARPPRDDLALTMPGPSFSDDELSSHVVLAGAYRARFTAAAEKMAADALCQPCDAALVDWILRHWELFAPSGSDARRHVAAAAEPFITAQTELAAELPRQVHTAPAMFDGNGVDECVMLRGNFKTPGDVVPRRYLEALGGEGSNLPADGSGRLQLARQMVDPAHPLLARVIVNRVWQHLFGRGLSASVDNLGVLGERPTNRELLDRLAGEFMSDGWSIKRLIRRLMLTSTYQLDSRPSELARQTDPKNLLLSHASVKRLEAEAIRDSVLAVSGRLDRRLFGPRVPIYLSEFVEGRGRPANGPIDGEGRRSVYLSVRRNFLNTFFLAFDYPVPFTSVGQRTVSNVPAQALTMLNSPLVSGEARRWAEAALSEMPDAMSRIRRLYVAALGRPPTDREQRQAAAFVSEQAEPNSPGSELTGWSDFCHVLFNAKEFLFVE